MKIETSNFNGNSKPPARMTPQQLLFQHLRENLPATISLADEMGSLLNISTDSAYRRMRGETPLTTDELVKICTHFKLSIDQLLKINSNNQTLFDVNRIEYPNNTFEHFLLGILQQMRDIKSYSSKEIIYVSKDIPVFYFFNSPQLLAFKHFFWMKTILQHPDYATLTFNPHIVHPGLDKVANEILHLYNEIPSIEVWNIESINSTILQLEYYRHTNIFASAADIKLLYDVLLNTIDHVEKQAEYGTKFLPGEELAYKPKNFKFFCNSVVLADNTIFVTTAHLQKAFINYGVLNYLSTSDEKFCSSVYHDLQNLMRKSTLISNGGARQRSMFFNSLKEKIEQQSRSL